MLLSQTHLSASAGWKDRGGREPLRLVTGSLLVERLLFAEPDVVSEGLSLSVYKDNFLLRAQ